MLFALFIDTFYFQLAGGLCLSLSQESLSFWTAKNAKQKHMAVSNWKEKNQIENHQYWIMPLKQLNEPSYRPVQSEKKKHSHNEVDSIVSEWVDRAIHSLIYLDNSYINVTNKCSGSSVQSVFAGLHCSQVFFLCGSIQRKTRMASFAQWWPTQLVLRRLSKFETHQCWRLLCIPSLWEFYQ